MEEMEPVESTTPEERELDRKRAELCAGVRSPPTSQESMTIAGCGAGHRDPRQQESCLVCLWEDAQRLSKCLRHRRNCLRRSKNCLIRHRGKDGVLQPSSVDENSITAPETDPAYIRWRKIMITQFGFVNNVALILTAPTIGLAVSKAQELSGEWKFGLFCGVVSLMLSGLFALLCAFTRLLDFRLTAQIAATVEETKDKDGTKKQRDETKKQDETEKRLEELVFCYRTRCDQLVRRSRAACDQLGDKSWRCLSWQLLSFAIGALVVCH